MQKIFNRILGLSTNRPPAKETRTIKTGVAYENTKSYLASKGLELYADTLTKTFWIWDEKGSSIKGAEDGFDTMRDVNQFVKRNKI